MNHRFLRVLLVMFNGFRLTFWSYAKQVDVCFRCLSQILYTNSLSIIMFPYDLSKRREKKQQQHINALFSVIFRFILLFLARFVGVFEWRENKKFTFLYLPKNEKKKSIAMTMIFMYWPEMCGNNT